MVKPNRLIHESSPYLVQHANNPVDWYPWGEEALSRARELDRPIFLSVGYSSCHWCHVMERESFEDPEIAEVLNRYFINIKVDREERPDLDAVYMQALQMLTRSGGWPMSVFLTPDLRPFWGGTYFPPTRRHGRPGFREILLELAKVYSEDRDTVEKTASKLFELLSVRDDFRAEELPGESIFATAVDYAFRTFDRDFGGFGPAPKFPRSLDLAMLLRAASRGGDQRVLEVCEKTLDAMAQGGIYDHLGGGFHRYSTDAQWLVPHFEKMLYDNALLARTYLEAYQVTGKQLYRRVATEVLDYVLRDMTSPEGGFYSATDADSEGREGAFFVWRPEQVEEILGREEGRWFCHYYNITEGGNFEDRTSILHVTGSIEDVARAFRVEPGTVARSLGAGKETLYRKREDREKPFRDEKILTSWNGLMISALARGYQVDRDPRYREAACRAADLLLDCMFRKEHLLHVKKGSDCRIPGFLDDYTCLAEGLLDLYEATFDPGYLRRARELTDLSMEKFWDNEGGGFYYTSPEHTDLIVRRKEPYDGATPSGGGVGALNLLRLERLTGRDRYRRQAEEFLRSVKGALERAPMAFGSTLIALDFLMHSAFEIAVVGDLESDAGRSLVQTVHEVFLPARVLTAARSPVPPELAREIPLLEGKEPVEGEPAAYVCRDFACQEPTCDPATLRRALEVAASRKR